MRKSFKTITAATLSAAMLLVPAMTSFAADPEANTSEQAAGNILAYSTESVIVPTSIKLTLNPNELKVTKSAYVAPNFGTYVNADGDFDPDKTYYTQSAQQVKDYTTKYVGAFNGFGGAITAGTLYVKGGTAESPTYTKVKSSDAYDASKEYVIEVEHYTYTVDDSVTEESYATKKDTLFVETVAPTAAKEEVSFTDQIVSLNYGCVNKSTMDKLNKITFTLGYEAGEDATKNIVFVDSADKVAAYDAETNENGAKEDEYKIYLAVAASTAAPKADAETPFAISRNKTTYAAEDNADRSTLSDVDMTASEDGNVAFVDGEAQIAFKMGKATYGLKDGAVVNFDTTQAQLADKVEMITLGDVIGFTFVGAMNKNADWKYADATSITITPVYDYTEKATADVELLGAGEGGYQQIATEAPAPALSLSNATVNNTDDGVDFNVTFTQGTALTCEFTGLGEDVTLSSVVWGTSATEIASTTSNVLVSGASFTINANMWGSASSGDVKYIKLTASDGSTKVIKVTIA